MKEFIEKYFEVVEDLPDRPVHLEHLESRRRRSALEELWPLPLQEPLHVATEVERQVTPDRVHVVAAPLGAVVLDEELGALDAVVVRRPRFERADDTVDVLLLDPRVADRRDARLRAERGR